MAVPDAPGAPVELVYRHTRLVRITHWINAVSFLFLVWSGGAILIAHPELYWGETGYFGNTDVLRLPVEPNPDLTLRARGMHFAFAWLLVLNGLTYVACGLANGHVRRDLLPSARQCTARHVLHEIREHLRLRPHGSAAARQYNVLQKGAYLIVVFLLFPLMLLTGLTMSPAVTAALPELLTLFDGRQSARTIHFVAASLLSLFLLVHIVQVFRAGAANGMRSMITGNFAIDTKERT